MDLTQARVKALQKAMGKAVDDGTVSRKQLNSARAEALKKVFQRYGKLSKQPSR